VNGVFGFGLRRCECVEHREECMEYPEERAVHREEWAARREERAVHPEEWVEHVYLRAGHPVVRWAHRYPRVGVHTHYGKRLFLRVVHDSEEAGHRVEWAGRRYE
jgi:hypothetical protein